MALRPDDILHPSVPRLAWRRRCAHIFWILLPIFSIFVVGFIAQKILHFDIPNLSKMSLYVLSPFLAFKTFYSHAISLDYLYYIGFVYLLCLILMVIITVISKILRYDEQTRCAMILGSCFMNNGNYGTPVVLAFSVRWDLILRLSCWFYNNL